MHRSILVQTVFAACATLWNALRLVVLIVLFSPVMATAHLALQHNIGRALWLKAFR